MSRGFVAGTGVIEIRDAIAVDDVQRNTALRRHVHRPHIAVIRELRIGRSDKEKRRVPDQRRLLIGQRSLRGRLLLLVGFVALALLAGGALLTGVRTGRLI